MPNTRPVSVIVACAVAASAVLVASPASPQPAAANGELVFVSGRSGAFRMYRVDPDSPGTAQPFAHGPAGTIDADPAWEPLGSRTAFARKAPPDETFDLMLKEIGPPPATRITEDIGSASNDRQPAWSPTTDRIAFTRTHRAAQTSNIYAVNPDGTGLAQLTFSPAGTYDASPAWSPDGLRIAFVSDRTGFPQIWTMDVAGGGQTQVTFGTCLVANPSWSPAGSGEMVFEQLCPGSPTGWDLVKLNVSFPSAPTQLTFSAEHDHQPAWSPDGTKIAFTRYGSDGNKDLYTFTEPGGSITPLTGGVPQADMSPDWEAEATSPRTAPARTVGGERLGDSDVGNASSPAAVTAPKKKKKRKRPPIPPKVIKGVRYREMRAYRSDVYVLKVSPPRVPRIDVSLSNDLLAGHEKTRNMAKRHNAVAAINGDFGTPSGRPSHTFAEDGDLKQVSFAVAPNFAISQDERTTFFDRPTEVVTAVETDAWPVERWNFGEPLWSDISAFTPAGGALEAPPANACSARLQAVGGLRWAPGLSGVEVDYQVIEVGCAATAFGQAAPGQVVLSAQPGSDGAILLNSLTVGEPLRLTWSVGWPGILDTVGGIPLLVKDGAIVATACPQAICNKHPRTGIGVTATGRILMVVVDGRREDSRGVTLVQFANLMAGLHAVQAINLDGGGSSTMVVRAKKGKLRVVNEPSDGSQRKVSSAVLVLKGRDPGEVVGAPVARAPAPARDRAGEIAAVDPASTGGLAEALVEGSFGRPIELSRELRRALRLFRSAR